MPGPDIADEDLVKLLDAEQLLDEVRDTPANHIAEALATGIAAVQAGIDTNEVVQVGVRRTVR